MLSEEEMTGSEGTDIMIWASRVHVFGQMGLNLLQSSGLNVKALIATLSRSALVTNSFAPDRAEQELELLVAKCIYWGLIPALRFYLALWLADTWVFFIHRAEHGNKWLYSK